MMQFSAAPWRVLSTENARLCVEAARLHIRMSDRILALARQSADTGEPIVRYMEYQFPGQGMETVTDQFMLGGGLLVARCFRRGRAPVPSGSPGALALCGWDGYDGGAVTVGAPLDCLPYFEKIG